MAQVRVERLAQARRVPIVGEDGEALVGIAAYPDRLRAETIQGTDGHEAPRLGTLANDGDIRAQTAERSQLAVERHTAIPGHKPHVRASPGSGWASIHALAACGEVPTPGKCNAPDRPPQRSLPKGEGQC